MFLLTYVTLYVYVHPYIRLYPPGPSGQGFQALRPRFPGPGLRGWGPQVWDPRSEPPRLGTPGQGPQARAPRPPSLGLQAMVSRLELSSQGFQGRAFWLGRMDGHFPSGVAALLTIRKSGRKKKKQDKGTADHILTLVDYCAYV